MKTLFLASMLSTLLAAGTQTKPLDKPGTLPEKCPSVSSISSQGLDYVAPFIPGRGWIGVKENSHYDTNDTWTFTLFTDSDAKNGRIAIQQLSKKISSFNLKFGPRWDDEMGLVYCEYETGGHSLATAFTPSLYE